MVALGIDAREVLAKVFLRIERMIRPSDGIRANFADPMPRYGVVGGKQRGIDAMHFHSLRASLDFHYAWSIKSSPCLKTLLGFCHWDPGRFGALPPLLPHA